MLNHAQIISRAVALGARQDRACEVWVINNNLTALASRRFNWLREKACSDEAGAVE